MPSRSFGTHSWASNKCKLWIYLSLSLLIHLRFCNCFSFSSQKHSKSHLFLISSASTGIIPPLIYPALSPDAHHDRLPQCPVTISKTCSKPQPVPLKNASRKQCIRFNYWAMRVHTDHTQWIRSVNLPRLHHMSQNCHTHRFLWSNRLQLLPQTYHIPCRIPLPLRNRTVIHLRIPKILGNLPVPPPARAAMYLETCNPKGSLAHAPTNNNYGFDKNLYSSRQLIQAPLNYIPTQPTSIPINAGVTPR